MRIFTPTPYNPDQIVIAEEITFAHKLMLGAPYLTTVYNVEVEEFHTYYVGEEGVWVHNTNCTFTVASKEIAVNRRVTAELATNRLNEGNTCFEAGTLVHTREGLRRIEDISVGDWVLSYPENAAIPDDAYREAASSKYMYRQVTKIFAHDSQRLHRVTVLDIGNDIEESFGVTANHPIYVENAGWTRAENLKFWNALVNRDFANLLVQRVEAMEESAPVYNLEVDEFHTYFVGQLGVWVHNKGSDVTPLPSLKDVAERT